MPEQIPPLQQNANSVDTYQDDEISMLELAITLAKHKKPILAAPLLVGVLAAIYTLIIPPTYTADTKILPPQQQSSAASMLASQLGVLTGGAGASLGIKNPNDMYVSMLKSRAVSNNLIRRFQLKTVYETETITDTRKALESATKVTAGKDGLITISVDDHDPMRAASLANGYIEELQRLTQVLAVTDASQRRLFYEKQLIQVKQQLSDAEIALKQNQEQTGLFQLEAQGSAFAEASANLKAQIAMKEVQLNAMRTFATANNPDYVRTRQEVAGLRAQLTKIEVGTVPIGKAPAAGLENIRKTRDLKYYETLFELLSKQYELAKLDEAKESSLIQVLDKAVTPEKRSKPKRAQIVLIAALAAGFLAVLGAFVAEAMQKAKEDDENGAQLAQLRNYLRWN